MLLGSGPVSSFAMRLAALDVRSFSSLEAKKMSGVCWYWVVSDDRLAEHPTTFSAAVFPAQLSNDLVFVPQNAHKILQSKLCAKHQTKLLRFVYLLHRLTVCECVSPLFPGLLSPRQNFWNFREIDKMQNFAAYRGLATPGSSCNAGDTENRTCLFVGATENLYRLF